MGWLITSIIIGALLFFVLGIKLEKGTYGDPELAGWGINKKQLCALFALLIMIPAFVTSIPANSVGIKYSMFSGTSKETLSEGLKIKSPFDKIYKISTETQTTKVENLTTQTKDAQYLTSVLDIKYKVNDSDAYMVFKQYKTLKNMSENLIVPTTQRVLELVTTQYNVIDILGEKRGDVYAELNKNLSEEFAKYGVEFKSISFSDMDAGDALEAAITAEAVAKKEVETAAQQLLKAETEAKQKSVQAQAEQDAARIEAETKVIKAQSDKDANELLNQSLSSKVLEKLWIEKWNGTVPQYYGGSGTSLIFNTGNLSEK
jgi:regulator of protease activity HflC (stomatin/prohibitin superfamily)